MLKQVTLARNPLEPDTWTHHQVADVRDLLLQEFSEWPSTARIYHERVSSQDDVTPADEAGIERLGELPGPFYVVVYPADPVTILIAVVAVVVVAAVVLQPSIPTPTLRNTQNQSPNNELSDRSNKPRPLARIPDVFGTVRSTPDLIAVPYKVYKDHEEVEYAYMCIGRGTYDVSDVRDDNTQVIDIPGTSVEVYGPNTSPNSGSAPQLRIGTAINKPVYDVARSNAVNGQVLRPPNDQSIRASNNIFFQTPNLIKTSAFDFTDRFAAGDVLYVTGAAVYQAYINQTKTLFAYSNGFRFVIPNTTLPAEYAVGAEIQLTGALFSVTDPDGFWSSSYDLSGVYTIASKSLETVNTSDEGGTTTTHYCRVVLNSPASVNPAWNTVPQGSSASVGIRLSSGAELYNLNGTYTVLSVADDTITLSNPAAVNAAWSSLTTSPNLSPTLYTTGSKWIGPFVLDKANTERVVTNFIASNGLYKDDGKNQVRFDVTLELEITPINADGSVRGAVQTAQATVEGSATFRSTRAVTLDVPVNLPGRVRVRARRVTNADLAYEGSVVDEIKWRDVYAFAPIGVTNFGNVTTVQAVTYATAGALALKERKLNMLVTRKIPARVRRDYSFGYLSDWAVYGSTSLDASGGSLRCVASGSGNFGAMVAVPEFTTGSQVTVSVDVKTLSRSGFPLRVALYEPGGAGTGSGDVVLNALGPTTITLTATRNSGGTGVAKVLFYVLSSPVSNSFTIDEVSVNSGSYSNKYGFSNSADWGSYVGAALSVISGTLRASYVSGSNFGVFLPLPDWSVGDYADLSLDLKNLGGGTPAVSIGLHEDGGGGIASNLLTVSTTGVKTVRLTANRAVSGGKGRLLVYASAGAGRTFAIDQVRLRFRPSSLSATNSADDILLAVSTDPHIGNRPLSELDVNNIYETVDQVRDYFGHPRAAEFCYTFDADNLSFEETAQAVANAAFCVAYRRGNIIKLNFEKSTEDSTLLFNHRNKLPGSEIRTVRFGNLNNYDGVSLSYVSPEDDAIVTYYLPENRSAVNPQEIETLGVRNGFQAYLQAWRAWNKIRYQNVITEFTATQEADLLVTNDRILVADNTRSETQDGEVLAQDVLQLTLSQPTSFKTGVNYSIFLQHVDGTVESLGVSATSDPSKVVLAQAPRMSLALEDGLFARTTYILIGDDEPRGSAFLIAEKEPQTNFTSTVRAVKYDPRYYAQDDDYKTSAINADGVAL